MTLPLITAMILATVAGVSLRDSSLASGEPPMTVTGAVESPRSGVLIDGYRGP